MTIQIDWEPSGLAEKVGDPSAWATTAVKRDLERFKEFIEAQAPRPAPGGATSTRADVTRHRSGQPHHPSASMTAIASMVSPIRTSSTCQARGLARIPLARRAP